MVCTNCGRLFLTVALPNHHTTATCPTCRTVLSIINRPAPTKKSTRTSKRQGTRHKRAKA